MFQTFIFDSAAIHDVHTLLHTTSFQNLVTLQSDNFMQFLTFVQGIMLNEFRQLSWRELRNVVPTCSC